MSTQVAKQDRSPSLAVIEKVAAREGVDPMDLDESLFEAIDPDALDELVRSSPDGNPASDFSITFPFHGYEITVSSDGAVQLARGQIV